jgi:hypothetical protein
MKVQLSKRTILKKIFGPEKDEVRERNGYGIIKSDVWEDQEEC